MLGLSLDFLICCTCGVTYDLHLCRYLQGAVKLGPSGINNNVVLAVCSTAEGSLLCKYFSVRTDSTEPHTAAIAVTSMKPAWIISRKTSDCRVGTSLPTAHSPDHEYQIIHLPLKSVNQRVCVGALITDQH